MTPDLKLAPPPASLDATERERERRRLVALWYIESQPFPVLVITFRHQVTGRHFIEEFGLN